MPNMTKRQADQVLTIIYPLSMTRSGGTTGQDGVGVVLKAVQSSSCDQGQGISQSPDPPTVPLPGSYALAQEEALAEIQRIMSDPTADPADYPGLGAMLKKTADSVEFYSFIGLNSDDPGVDLRTRLKNLFAQNGANMADADYIRSTGSTCP